MDYINKSNRVFLSYRRTPSAEDMITIHKLLTTAGYDVFYDILTIDVGYFSTQIIDNIRVRSHFVLLLNAGTLNRCGQAKDWIKQEILTAIKSRRNIILLVYPDFPTELTFDKFDSSKIVAPDDADDFEHNQLKRFLNKRFKLLLDPENPMRCHVVTLKRGEEDNLSDLHHYLDLDISNVPVTPQLERQVRSLKRRILVLQCKKESSTRYRNLRLYFSEKGFDIATISSDVPTYQQIVQHDVIVVIMSMDAIIDLSEGESEFYHQVLFAHNYNKLIIPMIYDNAFKKYSDFPEKLIPLILVNAYNNTDKNFQEQIDRLAGYLSSPLREPNPVDFLSEDERRRGILAYSDGRYEEGDLHFARASEKRRDMTTHLRSVAQLVWGIERFKRANYLNDEAMYEEIYQEAHKNFKFVTQEFPSVIIPFIYKGRTNLKLKQSDLALADFKQAAELSAENLEVKLWHAIALYEQGNNDEALNKLNELKEGFEITFANRTELIATAYLYRARMHARTNDQSRFADVEADYDKAIALFREGNTPDTELTVYMTELGDFRRKSLQYKFDWQQLGTPMLNAIETGASHSEDRKKLRLRFERGRLTYNTRILETVLQQVSTSARQQIQTEQAIGALADVARSRYWGDRGEHAVSSEVLDGLEERWNLDATNPEIHQIRALAAMNNGIAMDNLKKDAQIIEQFFKDAVTSAESSGDFHLRILTLNNLAQFYQTKRQAREAQAIHDIIQSIKRTNMQLDDLKNKVSRMKLFMDMGDITQAERIDAELDADYATLRANEADYKNNKRDMDAMRLEIDVMHMNFRLSIGKYLDSLALSAKALERAKQFEQAYNNTEFYGRVLKETADATRALLQYKQAQEHYSEIVALSGITEYLRLDAKLGQSICAAWLYVADKKPESALAELSPYFKDTEWADYFEDDRFEAYMVCVQANIDLNHNVEARTCCDAARKIFSDPEYPLNPHQQGLINRLEQLCKGM